jgi:hypothetical protein
MELYPLIAGEQITPGTAGAFELDHVVTEPGRSAEAGDQLDERQTQGAAEVENANLLSAREARDKHTQRLVPDVFRTPALTLQRHRFASRLGELSKPSSVVVAVRRSRNVAAVRERALPDRRRRDPWPAASNEIE